MHRRAPPVRRWKSGRGREDRARASPMSALGQKQTSHCVHTAEVVELRIGSHENTTDMCFRERGERLAGTLAGLTLDRRRPRRVAFTELLVERPLALERGYNNLRQQSALPTMSRALSATSSDACLGLSEIIFTLDDDVARNSCRRRMMMLSNESRMA